MNKKTYICNISGGHGHFLTYVFDKCCTTTKDIDESPFDRRGRSHQSYSASGNFVFIDAMKTKLKSFYESINPLFLIIVKKKIFLYKKDTNMLLNF
jgi:hypothetical protein